MHLGWYQDCWSIEHNIPFGLDLTFLDHGPRGKQGYSCCFPFAKQKMMRALKILNECSDKRNDKTYRSSTHSPYSTVPRGTIMSSGYVFSRCLCMYKPPYTASESPVALCPYSCITSMGSDKWGSDKDCLDSAHIAYGDQGSVIHNTGARDVAPASVHGRVPASAEGDS